MLDAPIEIDQGPGLGVWKPENYENDFYGPSTLRFGVEHLADLTGLSRAVAEIANVVPNDYQPYVGRSAFAHKGGRRHGQCR